MEFAKDLFLTDARSPYLSLLLASRDLDAHRLLSALTPDEEAALHAALADGVAAVRAVLATAMARQSPEAGTTSFGCGT